MVLKKYIMSNITYFIMTSKKFKDRQNNVLQTWGKDVDLYFYSDEDSDDQKTIKVTDKHDYWSLEEKHVNIFKYLENNFLDKEWFFFCDDDTFVNTKELEVFADKSNKDSAYGCLINCWPNMKNLYYHSGGGGVLIHRDSLNNLCKNIKHKNTMFADVTLGLNFLENNIKMETDERFHSESPLEYNINDNEIKNNITFHHIKSYDEMNRLYNLL